MKVILRENVENLGSVGDVVAVRDGYARNFLFPRSLAVEATPANVRSVELSRAKAIKAEKERKTSAEDFAKKIRATSITMEVLAGEEGRLFGSVTSAEIADTLSALGLAVDKKDVLISRPIKRIGVHEVEVRCHSSVKAVLKVTVIDKNKDKVEPAAAPKPAKKAGAAEEKPAEDKAGAEKPSAEGGEAPKAKKPRARKEKPAEEKK